MKKHLKEKHEIENAISCKSIFGIHGCDYWFKYHLDSDGEEDYDEEEMDQHYLGPAHYEKIKKRKWYRNFTKIKELYFLFYKKTVFFIDIFFN